MGYLAQAESITNNWVNTTYPWAANEIVYTIVDSADMDTPAEIDALLSSGNVIDSTEIDTPAEINALLTSSSMLDSVSFDTKAELNALLSADVIVFKSDSTTVFS